MRPEIALRRTMSGCLPATALEADEMGNTETYKPVYCGLPMRIRRISLTTLPNHERWSEDDFLLSLECFGICCKSCKRFATSLNLGVI